LLLFLLDDSRFAIRADAVAEIIRAVAITPLPNAPAVIEGIIDLRGRMIPVFDLRRRFGLPPRELRASDHFIVVRAATRLAALHVDQVLDLTDAADDAIEPMTAAVSSAKHVDGVAHLGDGMALIHDVDAFLSAAEADALDAALEASEAMSSTS
jgi:purine-binding chemotaxis protein CheW